LSISLYLSDIEECFLSQFAQGLQSKLIILLLIASFFSNTREVETLDNFLAPLNQDKEATSSQAKN